MNVQITGLNNYLARNVARCLFDEGHKVSCLVRNKKLFKTYWREIKDMSIVEGDLFRGTLPTDLNPATQVAFYFNQTPINEMGMRMEMDLIALQRYIKALQHTACYHLIYVTKLADENVEVIRKYLGRSGIAYTLVRISNIIGKGSALMNILSALAKSKLVLLPREFATSRCQPIHLSDVCAYLNKIIGDTDAFSKMFDVGGPEVMTYKEAFERYMDITKLKKKVLALPGLSKPMSFLLGRYVYKFEQDVAAAFNVYMRKDLVAGNHELNELYPTVVLSSYGTAVQDALL